MKQYQKGICCLLLLMSIVFNVQAQEFKPDSVYSNGRQYFMWDSTFTTSKFGLGGNFFIGKGMLSGNLSHHFSNPFLAGFNIEVGYKRFVFQFEDCFGFGKNIRTIYFPNQLEWKNGKRAYHFIGGVNLGHALIDNTKLKVVPLGGIGANLISSTFLEDSEISNYQPFIPYYNLGVYLDLKPIILMHYYNRANDIDVDYTCLRLSFGIKTPIKTPEFSEYYNGSMIYITIGMGVFERGYSSPKLEYW